MKYKIKDKIIGEGYSRKCSQQRKESYVAGLAREVFSNYEQIPLQQREAYRKSLRRYIDRVSREQEYQRNQERKQLEQTRDPSYFANEIANNCYSNSDFCGAVDLIQGKYGQVRGVSYSGEGAFNVFCKTKKSGRSTTLHLDNDNSLAGILAIAFYDRALENNSRARERGDSSRFKTEVHISRDASTKHHTQGINNLREQYLKQGVAA